jgi:hyperosmotically inducible periplasmic protein
MKRLLTIACFAFAGSMAPALTWAGEDADMDRSQPTVFVKDSAITAKVKAKLASEHLASLSDIHVDTDANGIVWLTGSVKSQMEADRAVATAKATEGVVSVKSDLKVSKDS